MVVRRFPALFLCALTVLAWCAPARVGAQLLDTLALRATDAGGRSFRILLGYHENATDGFDAAFGEIPVPPVPAVSAFDFRFLDRSWMKRIPSTGTYADIRAARTLATPDTFLVRIQPENAAYPVRIEWDPSMTAAFRAAMLEVERSGAAERVDMRAVAAAHLDADAEPALRIIITRAKGGKRAPAIRY
jgi:hypothetical protein